MNGRFNTKPNQPAPKDVLPVCTSTSPQTTIPASYGALLFELRTRQQLPQSKVATNAGVSVAYYSALENSKRHPPPNRRTKQIARALGADDSALATLVELGSRERFCQMQLPGLPTALQDLITSLIRSADKLTPAQTIEWLSQVTALEHAPQGVTDIDQGKRLADVYSGSRSAHPTRMPKSTSIGSTSTDGKRSRSTHRY